MMLFSVGIDAFIKVSRGPCMLGGGGRDVCVYVSVCLDSLSACLRVVLVVAILVPKCIHLLFLTVPALPSAQ